MYQDLADRVKNSSEVNILHRHFQTTGRELGLVPPNVQQCHLQLINNFDFAGYDRNKLVGCLGPFINVPPGAVSSEALARLSEERLAMVDYTTMISTEGLGTVTLADARAMNTGKLFISSLWAENEIQYQCHIVQCATFWGVEHSATKVLIKAYRLYEGDKLHFQFGMEEKYEVGWKHPVEASGEATMTANGHPSEESECLIQTSRNTRENWMRPSRRAPLKSRSQPQPRTERRCKLMARDRTVACLGT